MSDVGHAGARSSTSGGTPEADAGHDGAARPEPRPEAVELVAIGDELMLGRTVDGNSAWLGQRLAAAGLRVVRRTTVGDDEEAIRDAVRRALDRSATVLCTGGLGPTRDDVTKPVVARLLGRQLVPDEGVLEWIRERFDSERWAVSEASRSQADVPEGAVVFPNRLGTAPGLALEDDSGRIVVLLPGVPREMHALFDEHVLPHLLERRPERAHPVRDRTLRTTGIPESQLAARVDDVLDELAPLRVAFLPSALGVDLRITSWEAADEETAERRLDDAERRLRERLGPFVYGLGATDLAAVVADALRAGAHTLAVAESCTGGLIAKRLTDRPGASTFLIGGIVAYADDVKRELLGVRKETLRRHGAVSEPVARTMVIGVRRTTGANSAIAITGIAGPGGGTPEKPVGTVCYAAAVGDWIEVRRTRFPGDRDEIRERSAQAALALLLRILRREDV